MSGIQIAVLVAAMTFVVAVLLNIATGWYEEYGHGRCTGLWKVPSLLVVPWVASLLTCLMEVSLVFIFVAGLTLNI